MKIVMIGHKYVPSREGGVEIVVENLATRMAALGHEVTLFNRKRKEYTPTTEYKGCKIKNIFTVNKRSLDAIVYAFFATLKARKMLKKGEAVLVIPQSRPFFSLFCQKRKNALKPKLL